MAVARRWAGGRGGKPIPADDALTAASSLPDRAPAAAEGEIELVQDEAEPVGLFFALDTHWLRHPMSGARLGIDYAKIEPTARMLEIPMRPQMFTDLRDMELAALAVMAERQR